jgi:hypothetical protein
LHSGVGTTSIAIIVAAYLLGIGVGSYVGARTSRALTAHQALTCFAILEISIGLIGFVSPWLLYDLLYEQLGWMYSSLAVACVLHMATLIVPTALMGATLPLMTRALVRDSQGASQSIGLLYGLNTLGAACGAALAPWLLMPIVGVAGACSVGAATNFLVALYALRLRSEIPTDSTQRPDRQSHQPQRDHSSALEPARPLTIWIALYFLGGFCAIGLEICWFRVLDVALKSTAYTFGTLLAIYLSTMALGSIVGSRSVEQISKPFQAFLWTQWLVLTSAAISVLAILYVPGNWWFISDLFKFWSGPDAFQTSWSKLFPSLGLYGLLPLVLMGYSTYLMGFSFCILQKGVQQDASTAGYRVGVLQAANICGCILGSLLVGLWSLNALGTSNTLRALVVFGAIFAAIGVAFSPDKRKFCVALCSAILLAGVLPSNSAFWLRFHGQASGSQSVIAEDVTGVAALTPEPDDPVQWRVSVNGKAQSHLPYGGFHSKLGALPATLHANPKSIAIIGLGSGNTAWAASCRPSTESLRVFEICTAEALLIPSYKQRGDWLQVHQFFDDPRVHIDGRDARHVLKTEEIDYDLIESDAIRPNGAYAGYLYSVEFFRLCGRRLRPGGFMCTWAPSPATISTFSMAFPHVLQLDGGYILIGSNQPIEFDRAEWLAKFKSSPLSDFLGPSVTRECISSIEQAVVTESKPDDSVPNTDLFPFDEFHL